MAWREAGANGDSPAVAFGSLGITLLGLPDVTDGVVSYVIVGPDLGDLAESVRRLVEFALRPQGAGEVEVSRAVLRPQLRGPPKRGGRLSRIPFLEKGTTEQLAGRVAAGAGGADGQRRRGKADRLLAAQRLGRFQAVGELLVEPEVAGVPPLCPRQSLQRDIVLAAPCEGPAEENGGIGGGPVGQAVRCQPAEGGKVTLAECLAHAHPERVGVGSGGDG